MNEPEAARQMQTELSALGMDDQTWLQDRPQPNIPPEDVDDPVGAPDPSDEPDLMDRERAVKAGQALIRAMDQLLSYAADVRGAAVALVEAITVPTSEEEEPTDDGEDDNASIPEEP